MQAPRARTEGDPGPLAALGPVLLLVLPPLVVLPGLHEPFRLPKQVASEILALATLAALTATVGRMGSSPESPARWRTVSIAVFPLATVFTASALVSTHDSLALHAWMTFAIAAASLCGLAVWWPGGRRLLDVVALPACVLALIVLLQYLLQRDVDAEDAGVRLALTSLAGNVGDLSAYLVLPSLVALSRLTAANHSRVSWSALLALSIAALAAARTLVPFAALALGTAILLWYSGAVRRPGRWRWLAGTGLIALTVVVLSPLRARLETEWHELLAGSPADVLSGRLDGWRAGIHVGLSHPVLGAGPGSYRAEFAPAKLELAERGVSFYEGHGYAAHFDHAHSEPIEVFADLGVAGLLASAWLLWFLVRGALAQRKDQDRALGLAVIAAFGVLALFWFPLRTALVGWPFVVAGAWLLRSTPPLGSGFLAASESSPAHAQAPGSRGSRGWWRIVAAMLLGVTALLGSYVGVERLRANRILRDAEDRATVMAASGRIEPAMLASSVSRLQGARRGAPDDERIPLAIGSHHLLLGDLESAEAWYRESLALAPRAETFLNLGRLHWLRGDIEEARSLFAKAVVLNPALGPEVSAHLAQ